MKKIFITMMLCVMTIAASAQVKSIDVKGDLRGDFGLGVGITANLFNELDIAPRFNYYFADHATVYTIDADLHYNFHVADKWTVYPIAGLAYYHCGYKSDWLVDGKKVDSVDKIGCNLGVGCKYDITRAIGLFVEGKYQWIDGYDDTYFSLGVNIAI